MNKKIKKIEDVVTMPITKYVTTDGKKFTDDYDANIIFLLASYIQIYQVMMICISYRQKMRNLKKKF